MNRITRRHPITAYDPAHPKGITRRDTLAVEEPLEIRINGTAYTLTMRTPGHDFELVHGLLAAEGIISDHNDIATIRYCAGAITDEETQTPRNTYNVVDVRLAPGNALPENKIRASITTSACGVCGTASIEQLTTEQQFDLRTDTTNVLASCILELPKKLRQTQRAFDATGGLHASALFTNEGELLIAREDIGRHNATDKVIGWAMQNGIRPARGHILMVSGRTSFELAQKAALAGIPILAGVSAPSSLAVDVAEATGLTLAGFVRQDRMNIYAGKERILS
ncbi:formate dehydrogenase accessory sulfurtransferase FdhD [Dermatophilus congolensis]|uniref:formate dehydrogenase accessory sulfurtransferase FdhD n=3 Tax=Dermatophilus congolensis TaxID=1863 RepID=UPI001AAE7DAB|nr:formate dehydrogenase accessory sulfurtransferase FdhD [Dermatophilus congolensis]MBO3143622.1 formate dehydrogenase accessory sulfurtransferase FdhD [Dermatophilus congolensis]MBO3152615.1 formate dehydrogenase accessory sulfurtransferase FdhD [Dermatophilus congolensis]MBO3160374.1 formate dehydrogenase accessory sulfurtransferase FdhD [Dermatophilus congolensis]MBO3163899.1 formate dehydrogenase accessory sulfurtransferase FdhD [Dermatophilus congolensis]MBO3184215.1 formate dehydrogenas